MEQPGPGAPPPPFEASQYPAAPPAPARRFGVGGVVLGLLVGAAVVPVVALSVLFGTARVTGSGIATLVLGVLVGLVLPVVAGVVAVRQPDPGRRGFGLGLLIGWLLSTVIVIGGLVLIFRYVIQHAG